MPKMENVELYKLLFDANLKLFEPPPLHLKEIPRKFKNYAQYKEIFYPLLIEETRETIKNCIVEKIGEQFSVFNYLHLHLYY